jgi:hypothetical protein
MFITSLAYCELFLTTAALAIQVFPHMKLFETTIADVKHNHELFIEGSNGVRATIG